ncbi:hypothetical protein V3481_005817 [Fusarium oxysporum f. sp. vasinfectum]|uniref:Sodium-and chloride-dependent GABA transporter 1 n=1 Tax=Fusarium oxysporum f. sp. vasinfectum 25433 TaxID=1089449 RepID=X0KLT5_FUSOX|nr:hypothetical protein FOTG_17110 [Fusarium oxysporum f. sp. vasinfectum 25433]
MNVLRKIGNLVAPPPQKAEDGRDQWPSRTAYLLASCGGAVGMGNMLRYPSQVYNNNGLQWFVPYLMTVFLLAIPAMALEIATGNAYRGGTVVAYNSVSRRMKGIGFSLNYVGFVVVIYFVPILAWAMVYFQKSFTNNLPWAGDTENWFMYEAVGAVDPDTSGRWVVYPGVALNGRLVGWNAFTWFTVWLCMFRGVGLTGRVVYFTMGLPVIMGIILIGRGVSLPDASEGIKLYFASWHSSKLAGTRIWRDAVGQVFFSTGIGFGYYTAYASYNRKFANAAQDAVMTLILDSPFARNWSRPWVATTMVTICFLLSLPHCTQFGYFFIDGIDRWINNIGLVFVVWAECVGATTLYRLEDVVGQVGMPSFALYNVGFLGGQLLGIIVGHTATPWAGAIAGFGLYFICLAASLIFARTPDAHGAPRLLSKNKLISVLYYVAFYSGNQLRHDLNSVIGNGNNWSLPFLWAPMLRYVSGPILAIIFSLAYPSFEEVKNDPLYILGFIVAHLLLVWCVIGFVFPRWFNIFIVPERRDDWKQPYAPNVLRGTTEGEDATKAETGMSSGDASMSNKGVKA